MTLRRILVLTAVVAGLIFAGTPQPVQQAAAKAQQQIAKTPDALAKQFRALAAKDLARYPDLAAVFGEAPTVLATAPAGARPARPQPSPEATAISKSMGTMRSLATDEERAALVNKLAGEIRALPSAGERLMLASSMCNLSTEGDLGKAALNAAASTLALALKDAGTGGISQYMELASLIRYEHVTVPPADPALNAATSVLELRDTIRQEAGFSLQSLDGKTYNLDALKGKVVLLNFWATWCPPCRREMPDMEKLSKRFASKGLVVLAVSDEKRETVEGFQEKQNYTYPILLDPDRKVNSAYFIEGIPHSFLFDRTGKMVAQSIDMRTERQFLEMFKAAGLE
jgi:peroxiredoxin